MNETQNTTEYRLHNGRKHAKMLILIIIIAGLLACGNIIGGWFVANGLYHVKMGDKYVSVKGLAEKRVKADLAIWNLTFKAASDDLQSASNKINDDQKNILAFLAAHGIKNEEIEIQQTSVIDLYANEYSSGNKPQNRYIITGGVKVRTDKVELIKQVSSSAGELIAEGIVLLSKDYTANPRYLFTKLDDARPQMLEDATKSARLVAEQFAINSGTTIGAIKHASQGIFQIFGADKSSVQETDYEQENSMYKTIRVVSSIDYYLAD